MHFPPDASKPASCGDERHDPAQEKDRQPEAVHYLPITYKPCKPRRSQPTYTSTNCPKMTRLHNLSIVSIVSGEDTTYLLLQDSEEVNLKKGKGVYKYARTAGFKNYQWYI